MQRLAAWLSFVSCWRVPSRMTSDFSALSFRQRDWLQLLMYAMVAIMSCLACCTSPTLMWLYSCVCVCVCVSSAKQCDMRWWRLVTACKSAAYTTNFGTKTGTGNWNGHEGGWSVCSVRYINSFIIHSFDIILLLSVPALDKWRPCSGLQAKWTPPSFPFPFLPLPSPPFPSLPLPSHPLPSLPSTPSFPYPSLQSPPSLPLLP